MANLLLYNNEYSNEGKKLNMSTPQHLGQKDKGTDISFGGRNIEKWYRSCPDIHTDNNNSNILSKTQGDWQAAYGAIEASSGFHEWTLKIIQKSGSMSVGISSDIQNINKTQNAAFHDEPGYANYAYISYGSIMNQSCKEIKYPFNINNGLKYNLNDVLTITLDLDKGLVSFGINGKNLGIAFKNIKKGYGLKYRLAVSMYGKNECVELLSYWSVPTKPKLPLKNILNKQLKELKSRFNEINLSKLEERFKRHHPFLKQDSSEILKEYKRFLIIKIIGCDYNARIYSSCFAVDQYWHLHVLDTRQYFKDVNMLLNNGKGLDVDKFIHHDIDGDVVENKRILRYNNTINDYQIIFEEMANPKYWNEKNDIYGNELDDDSKLDGNEIDLYENNMNKNVQLYIKTLTGKTHTIDIDVMRCKVKDIKNKLEEKYGIPACQSRLIGAGKELDDEQQYANLYRKGVETLHLLMKLRC